MLNGTILCLMILGLLAMFQHLLRLLIGKIKKNGKKHIIKVEKFVMLILKKC